MYQHSIKIAYNDPVTKKRLERVYMMGVNESYDKAILSIRRALNFIYEVRVGFDIIDKDER